MRKTLCVLPFCALVLLAQGPRGEGPGPIGFGGFGVRGPGILGAGTRVPISGAPYSATETLTMEQALPGNQISRKQTSTIARDSQGRISTTETVTPAASTGKSPYTIETIFDPVAGYRYELNSATMIAIETPLPKRKDGNRPAGMPPTKPTNPNITTTSLGMQTVNGVAATGTQLTETIPAGAIGNVQPIQVIRVTWVSTDLKVPVQIKSSDPRFGTSDLEVTNIVEGEPAATLFVVPAGYTVKQGGRGLGGPGRQARRNAGSIQ